MVSDLAERYCSSNIHEKDKQEDKSWLDFQLTYLHLYFVWAEFPLSFLGNVFYYLLSRLNHSAMSEESHWKSPGNFSSQEKWRTS